MKDLFRILNYHKLFHGELPIRLFFSDDEGETWCFSASAKLFKRYIKNGFFKYLKYVGVFE